MRSLLALLVVLVGACQAPSGMVAYAATGGAGDVRTDGDTIIIVGDIQADLGVRTETGIPIFVVPPIALARDEWYVRSTARAYEQRAPLSQPLPYWTRPFFLEQDLVRLRALGITLLFEPTPPVPPEVS